MEVGPDKVRRRVSYTAENITGQVMCTEAQAQALDLFYKETVRSGTIRFTMNAPHFGLPREARFLEPPEFSWIGGNLYQCTLNLELFDTATFLHNAIWPSGDNMVWPSGDNMIWPEISSNW